jgi:hypothetical protein
VKLVHLVGFITKKFVTMHGHMNVKDVMAFSDFFKSTDFYLDVLICPKHEEGVSASFCAALCVFAASST